MMDNQIKELANKIPGRKYAGSSIIPGKLYHDLPFDEFKELSAHRTQTLPRWDLFKDKVDFNNKRIIDIGCSAGAFSLLVAKAGAKEVTGYEQDEESLVLANLASQKMNLNVNFVKANIDLDFIKKLPEVDVVICLSVFMWFRKFYGENISNRMLYEISKKAEILIFEVAAENDGMAPIDGLKQDQIKDVLLIPNTVYSKIKDLGFVHGWHNRHIFICER